MRPYFESEPGSAPLAYVANVSWPRSGHHLLVRVLENYFGPRFGYCEYHVPSTDPKIGCCGQFPCTKRNVISMSKNHDFDLDSPVPSDVPLIVQWREPLAAIQSEFELTVRGGAPDTRQSFELFAQKRAATYRRFLRKWLEAPIQTRLAVEYDEFAADPLSIMRDVIALWGEGEPDMDRLKDAIDQVSHVSVRDKSVFVRDHVGVRAERAVTAFRYYDEELAASISSIALGKAAAPFRVRRTRAQNVGVSVGRAPAAPEENRDPAPPVDGPALRPGAEDKRSGHKLQPGERLVLMLVPGCGGAALSRAIAAQFAPHEVFRGSADLLPEMAPKDLRAYRFFTGHFSKYGIDAIPGPKRVVAVLDDPRQRILRLHAIWAAMEGADSAPTVRLAKGLNRPDFLNTDNPAVLAALDNRMVRNLLGPVQHSGNHAFRLDHEGFAVETALENLRRLSFVAFADLLAEDAALLGTCLGLGPIQPRTITDPPTAPFPPANEREAARINALTRLDSGLYARARDLRHTLRCPYPL